MLEISDQTYQPPADADRGQGLRRARPAPVPVQAGENAYNVQVNVTFELK